MNNNEYMKVAVEEANINMKENFVNGGPFGAVIVKDGKIGGVILADGTEINAKAVILTTGTYLRSSILIGSKKKSEGPHGEKESKFLSTKLKELGFTEKEINSYRKISLYNH